MARDKDFDLRAALAKPSFTPGQRDIGPLVDLVATDEDASVRASPALAKLGEAARMAIVARIGAVADIGPATVDMATAAGTATVGRTGPDVVDDGGAARLVVTLGLMARANDREARAELIARVGDARVRVRRAAIVALGKLGATRATRTDQRDDARREDTNESRGSKRDEGLAHDNANEPSKAPGVELREGVQRDDARRDDTNESRGSKRDEGLAHDNANEPSKAPGVDLREGVQRDDAIHRATPVVELREGVQRDDAGHRSTPVVDLRESVRRESERRTDENPPLVELRDGQRRGDDRRASEPDDDVRAALIARWDAIDVPPDERRALAEALGKIGGAGVRERLESIDAASDKELARRRDRALLVTDREEKRGEDSEVLTDRAPPRPLVVRLGCRPALAELLIAEARAAGFDGKAVRDDSVDVPLAGAWNTLFASRLWASAAIRIEDRGLREAKGDRAKVTDAIVRAVVSDEVRGLMTAWTRGPIRWRLSLERGHQRAVVWTVAKEVTRRAPMLINDPTQTTWDVRVDDEEGVLELVPRRAPDPRFDYRVAEVPAASHPSVAAAVVWLAGIEAGDRVWDPFCGSGLELVEAALRGAVTLVGSDLDDEALAAARANFEAAAIPIEGERARDADRERSRITGVDSASSSTPRTAHDDELARDASTVRDDGRPGGATRGRDDGRANAASTAHDDEHARDPSSARDDGRAIAVTRARDDGRATRRRDDDARDASSARDDGRATRRDDGGATGASTIRHRTRAIATLARGDARQFAPGAPGSIDAIVTNPPLGSRVHVDAGALLADALPHLVRQLRPGGRLVWITPQWRRTTPAAEAQGLVLVRSLFVDLGGVRGRLERWDRRR